MVAKLLKKSKEKKGFTLVELIVVLIILAILAALLLPALTGYIDKAKEKQVIAATRQAVMAAQTLGDEVWAEGKTPKAGDTIGTDNVTVTFKQITDLAELAEGSVTTVTYGSKGEVTQLIYTHGGKTCTYDGVNKEYKF